MKFRSSAVRMGLLPAGIAIALSPTITWAQDAAEGATTLDRLEVTGSRIRSADIETAQPIFTVSSEDIKRSGLVSVGDILQNLTISGTQTFSKAAVLASNPEQGGQYSNLYNLGEQRNLVLVNGKRWSSSLAGFSDMSTIPSSLIQRIEVLKDGASAIYGSDAVSGVINIILRSDFDGAEASVYYGQNSRGDGAKTQYNITLGAAGERSSVMFGASYTKEDPVWARDRALTRDTYGPNHAEDGVSSFGPWGRFTDPNTGKAMSLNHTGSWDTPIGVGADATDIANYHPSNSSDYYNAVDQMMFNQGSENKSMFVSGRYDLTDRLVFKSTAMYSERDSVRQVAGYPLRQNTQPSYPISISGQSVYNPIGQDISTWSRRIVELPRISENNVKSFHFDAAVEGTFDFNDRPWDWDVGMNYNQYDVTETGRGNINLLALKNALGPSFINAAGVAQCGTTANPIALGTGAGQCTPFNVLGGPTGATPEALNYINHVGISSAQSKSKQYFANITGGLFDMWADAGEFAFAAGYEHRETSGYEHTDALSAAGYTTDLAAASSKGKYTADEVYLELMIPLLSGLPGARELSLDIAGRYSDFDKFGDTLNSKFSLTWKPIDDLMVRATYGEGFRAPTLDDTFGGGSQSYDTFTDPCDAVYGQRGNAAVDARCGAQGLAADYRQTDAVGRLATGYNTQSVAPFNAGVGNTELKPETSKTRTVGLVYSPNWVPGLDVSLDWYKITVNNVITSIGANYVLSQCYLNDVQKFCDQFARDSITGQITSLSRGNENLGALETEGYNIGAHYKFREFAIGQFGINLDANYLSSYRQQSTAGSAWDEYAGYWNFPRVRATLGVNWSKGDLSANWGMRYYGGFRDYCWDEGVECNQPNYQTGNGAWDGGVGANKKGAIVYHDVSVTWNAPWNGSVTVGARNLFDKQPPVTYSVGNSSSASIDPMLDYDRYLFVQYTQKF